MRCQAECRARRGSSGKPVRPQCLVVCTRLAARTGLPPASLAQPAVQHAADLGRVLGHSHALLPQGDMAIYGGVSSLIRNRPKNQSAKKKSGDQEGTWPLDDRFTSSPPLVCSRIRQNAGVLPAFWRMRLRVTGEELVKRSSSVDCQRTSNYPEVRRIPHSSSLQLKRGGCAVRSPAYCSGWVGSRRGFPHASLCFPGSARHRSPLLRIFHPAAVRNRGFLAPCG